MELQLNQWRSNESEQQQQPSAKFPRLPQHEQSQSGALPFFLSEHNTRISSGLSDNNSSFRFPRMGSRFSLGQLQELELQALIYKYMVAGAAVPPELLQPIKRSLLHSPSYLLHHPLQHLEPSLMNAGLWGRAGIELEPRRCRRTDGKKWRCARDVVAGHKYCDRHVHRGRSRSRKPVESTPNVTSRATSSAAADASLFGFSGSSDSSTIQLLQLNNSPLDSKPEHKNHFQIPDGVDRSDGHILRPFFDDWSPPQKTDYNSGSKTDTMNSKNLSSDVSLKLCTGNGDELGLADSRREPPPQLGWGEGWAVNRVASMGGPLAEALRSSTNSSPTSVLHQMARGSASETSYVSA